MRESKRDRSARERAQDDGAQAAQRKRAKRDELSAEKAAAALAAAKQECCAVHCSLFVKPQYGVIPSKSYLYEPGPRLRTEERAAAAERDWQERVREGHVWRHYFAKPDGTIDYSAGGLNRFPTAEAAAAATTTLTSKEATRNRIAGRRAPARAKARRERRARR